MQFVPFDHVRARRAEQLSGEPLDVLVGVKVYDLLCSGRNLGPSRAVRRKKCLAYLPGLNPERLTGAVRYYDGLTQDARLVLDTLRSAANHGALVANYTRWEQAERDGTVWRCRLRDVPADRSLEVSARTVVNATADRQSPRTPLRHLAPP